MSHVEPVVEEGLPQEADHHVLLLEDGEHLADGGDRLERGRHVRRPVDEDLLRLAVVVVDQAGAGGGDQAVGGLVAGGDDRRGRR